MGEAGGHGDNHGHEAHAHASPASRVIALAKLERSSIWVVVVYAIMVGLLALAVPIAVQSLVNTVAFGALVQPIVVLTVLVGGGLAFEATVLAMKARVVESIQERIFVRTAADVAYRLPRVQGAVFDEEHGPELVNHFFEVMTVQKTASFLLLDGIGVVLQTGIGLLLLAFYHPALLAFDLVLVGFVVFVFVVLGRGATRTSIRESQAKYSVEAWLEELARHRITFKSPGGAELALSRVDALCQAYIARRRDHFAILFRQIVGVLAIYVIASAALLGLGGWLVLARQLTLGQLVAAELVVGAVVAGVAKFGKHLENYYDMLAAVDKLGHLSELPLEHAGGHFPVETGRPAALELRGFAVGYARDRAVSRELTLQVDPGQHLAVGGENGAGASALLDTLYALRPAIGGVALLDGVPLQELDVNALRSVVALVRDPEIFEGTVGENVRVGRAHIDTAAVRSALKAVGLDNDIAKLPSGLDSTLATGGAPLSSGQAARLALARAIAGQPRLLLVDGILDRLDGRSTELAARAVFDPAAPWTLLLATRREELRAHCRQRLHLEPEPSRAVGSLASLPPGPLKADS